ncbi:hypothetical protein CBL_11447 [Carabus blaptoides fortunei]
MVGDGVSSKRSESHPLRCVPVLDDIHITVPQKNQWGPRTFHASHPERGKSFPSEKTGMRLRFSVDGFAKLARNQQATMWNYRSRYFRDRMSLNLITKSEMRGIVQRQVWRQWYGVASTAYHCVRRGGGSKQEHKQQ